MSNCIAKECKGQIERNLIKEPHFCQSEHQFKCNKCGLVFYVWIEEDECASQTYHRGGIYGATLPVNIFNDLLDVRMENAK